MKPTPEVIRIDVPVAPRPYPVLIGTGALSQTGLHCRAAAPHDRAMLVVDAAVAQFHLAPAQRSLEEAGYRVSVCEMRAAESSKTLDTVARICDAMLEARLERGSPLVALGGGIVGDTAGFAAAIYLRGVPLVHLPTTLLAMVDASIGGKTGVNHPVPGGAGALGKNLIGCFWQPHLVIADPLALATLPPRELRCGLAECVKHGLLGDAALLADLRRDAVGIAAADARVLQPLIARSARIKVAIVARDVRESGERALLNLGHTFAHALEPLGELDLRHGEAVSVGLCAAAHAARLLGRLTCDEARQVEETLAGLNLPRCLPRPVELARLAHLMGFDKKVAHGRLRLILPRGLGAADIVEDVPADVIERAWRHVGAA
jgi:3-dehydroquinate synthase